MTVSLQFLLQQVPSDTQERVERARTRLNLHIREALRQETGLRLNRRSSDESAPSGGGRRDTPGVRISLERALPVELRERKLDEQYWLAALVAPWAHTLKQLRDSARTVEDRLVPSVLPYPRAAAVVAGRADHLWPASELAEALLRETQGFDLVQWILEVDEDVLGTYAYFAGDSLWGSQRLEPRIRLYWAVIGLVAQVLGQPPEDLAAVVLTHELAHAYTHVGLDIDGDAWPADDFADSGHDLKEGLAQYYTERVADRLSEHAPSMAAAYRALLPHQPEAYQTHRPWSTGSTPEEVRLAMLECRRIGPASLDDFNTALEAARNRLRKERHAVLRCPL